MFVPKEQLIVKINKHVYQYAQVLIKFIIKDVFVNKVPSELTMFVVHAQLIKSTMM